MNNEWKLYTSYMWYNGGHQKIVENRWRRFAVHIWVSQGLKMRICILYYIPYRIVNIIIIRPIEWNIDVIIIGSCSPPHRVNSSLQASAPVHRHTRLYDYIIPYVLLPGTGYRWVNLHTLLFYVRIRHPERRRRTHYKRIMIA